MHHGYIMRKYLDAPADIKHSGGHPTANRSHICGLTTVKYRFSRSMLRMANMDTWNSSDIQRLVIQIPKSGLALQTSNPRQQYGQISMKNKINILELLPGRQPANSG